MQQLAYVVYCEDEFMLAQCLNVDVSSFGSTRAEAVASLKEAVELYFEDEPDSKFAVVADLNVGEEFVNA